MSYRVFWSPYAEQRLEEILQDTVKQRILRRLRDRSTSFSRATIDFGESRYDTVRIGFVRPLGVQLRSSRRCAHGNCL